MRRKIMFAARLFLFCAMAHAQDLGSPVLLKGKDLRIGRTSSASKSGAGGVFSTFGPSDPIAADFNVILFRGRSSEVKFVFEAALQSDRSRWVRAQIWRFDNGYFWGRVPISGKAGDVLVFRLRDQSMKAAQDISISGFETAVVAENSGSCLTNKSSAAEIPVVLEGGITIISRDAWGAACEKAPYDPMIPVSITIHHTAGPRPTDREGGIREMRIIQHYHQVGRGWGDIGYHFLIDGTGDIFEGRPMNVSGAHVPENNEGNIGISLMGDFEPTADSDMEPSPEQMKSLKALVRWLVHERHINPNAIQGHKDFNSRTNETSKCPGTKLYAKLEEVREAAQGAFAEVSRSIPEKRRRDFSDKLNALADIPGFQ